MITNGGGGSEDNLFFLLNVINPAYRKGRYSSPTTEVPTYTFLLIGMYTYLVVEYHPPLLLAAPQIRALHDRLWKCERRPPSRCGAGPIAVSFH